MWPVFKYYIPSLTKNAIEGQCEDGENQILNAKPKDLTGSSNFFGINFNWIFREVESLLHDWGQLTDTTTFFTQYVLGSGGHNDDFGLGRSNTDLDARVTIFG